MIQHTSSTRLTYLYKNIYKSIYIYISMECNCELAGQWEGEVFQTFTHNTSIFIIDLYCYLVQINHQPDATIFQFIILTFIYSSTCFGRSPAHRQELNDCSSSLWFYLGIVVIAVLCSRSGRPAQPRTQHDCHHDTKVKPEAATAVRAPDDGRENARNMLSCKQTSG